MNPIVHLIAGPPEHGVTEYARLLHEHTGGAMVHLNEHTRRGDLPPGPLQVAFTDHLFGADPEAAVDRVLELAHGRWLSISLHDIPQPEEGAARFDRRSRAYRRLAAKADLVVTNSRHEAGFFTATAPEINPVVIHLPLPTAPTDLTGEFDPDSVGIVGFIYPGKGHADILAALSGTGLALRALGGFSAGHEDLEQQLNHQAQRAGVSFQASGYLADHQLWEEMARTAVPVCAHRHFSASGSLMRWLAAGRRVLVTESDYARELAAHWPEQIVLVAAGNWRGAIRAAAADPGFATPVAGSRTWSWAQVAGAWRRAWTAHLGPALVGNDHRGVDKRQPEGISVVIPYYNDPVGLQSVLDGLSAQDFHGEVEVIIADDGSRLPPEPSCVHPVKVVHQEDLGFRAAAARNLGAAHAKHSVLAFLDGDTVPEPGYLRAAAAWVAGDPRCVVVGNRLQNGAQPEWLAQAWADTENLGWSNEGSWRFLISAVWTCSAELFQRVGGFDATIIGYGGEDWELAWRLWQAGAVFVHEPTARAHHEEPDWGARAADPVAAAAEKNAETVALADRITHPLARPAGVFFDKPDVLVQLPAGFRDWAPGVVETCVASWLALGDVQVVIPGARPEFFPQLFSADHRVSATATWRTRIRVELDQLITAPPDAAELWEEVCELGGHVLLESAGTKVATVRSMRGRSRGPATAPLKLPVQTTVLDQPIRLESRFAGW